ncbi:hypothetical protein Rsub_10289 [Raphidocelis subcapitata]|uniref:START domain-containing protein n=1 Tax=Raphidocelis subcapitata TaxID=307507 RepID=A0A2V0PDX6_9CHLO|nr:hypothetical protein Rsub_10289 [Raphidocelis subcapitata]|eukprot:GBF98061.1 hypothetical protein Rsub_10289 [Raphidocelis subcapitata]
MATVKALKRPGGEFGASGRVPLAADADAVLALVADVESQPEWNRGVKAARVEEALGCNESTVAQTLEWRFLALRGAMHLRLRQSVDAAARCITTRLLRGTMMRSFGSKVVVESCGPGSCQLSMELYMHPSIAVPPGVRPFVGQQVRRQLHSVLTDLKAHVDARAGASGGGSSSDGGGASGSDGGGSATPSPCPSRSPSPPASSRASSVL